MAIWEHKGNWKDKEWLRIAWSRIKTMQMCLYCHETILDPLGGGINEYRKKKAHFCLLDQVCACPKCGWWFAYRNEEETVDGEMYGTLYGLSGSLIQFGETSASSQAVAMATFELQRHWDSAKHDVSPRLFEDIVAKVFTDFGYHAHTTGYTNDGGIDIVLIRESDLAGVQVKRYRNKIKVEQIRAFAGALQLNGLPKGVFVTTSGFQSGCHDAVDKYRLLGTPIELVNGEQFYSSLGIHSRPPYETWNDLFVEVPQQLTRFMAGRIC